MRKDLPLIFVTSADLLDEAAHHVFEFLQDFLSAFENHYFIQLRRYKNKLVEGSEL